MDKDKTEMSKIYAGGGKEIDENRKFQPEKNKQVAALKWTRTEILSRK